MADLSRPAGFPRQYRLTKTDEFSSVFGFRKAIRGQSFMLHYRHYSQEELAAQAAQPAGATVPGARLGVIVAKRLLKRAVHRNLVRRLAREAFRHLRPTIPPADIVLRLMVKPPRPLDRQQLAAELRQLLQKLYPARRHDRSQGSKAEAPVANAGKGGEGS